MEPLPADWAAWRGRIDVDAYERRWQRLAAAGVDPHGEVALVQTYAPRSMLDAGCGTGRVAAELARRGVAAVAACARHLAPTGVLVAGFALRPGWPRLADYDGWCTSAGLSLTDRWATWDRQPYSDGDYAVSAHTLSAGSPPP